LIIKKSIEHQVLTQLTGYICIIQENANANNNQGYLLEMKNSLEGESLLYSSFGPIYVKTLTGKTIQIDTKMNITVRDLKESIRNKEGIPPDQQRLLFGGKQMEDDKTL
jgi:large subunit ribosomal protein L40e